MIPTVPLVLYLASCTFAQTPLPNPPKLPGNYPGIDQTVMISGSFLTDPAILEAIEFVKAVVPADILAITPSVYNPATPNAPTYPAGDQAATRCYWPSGCLRTLDTPDFKADIYTCPTANDWGLTYDDGPTVDGSFGTTQLVEKLAETRAKATFYIVGSNAIQHPNVLKAVDAAGHELALHSWTHHPLTSLTNEQIVAELKYNQAVIFSATGKVVQAMRPPYGDIDDRVRAICSALGFRVDFWSSDSLDTSLDTSRVPATIATWFTAQPGFISLEHDINVNTTRIAIEGLTAYAATERITKPMPVSQCLGLTAEQWYLSAAQVNPDGSVVVNGGTNTVGSNNKSSSGARVGGSFLLVSTAIQLLF